MLRLDLKNELKRVLYEGGSGNFLIVSNGEYYIQFAGSPNEKELYCEVVSNQFLSRKNRINKEKMKDILKLGFKLPSTIPNYSKKYVINSEKDIDNVIEEIEQIFYGIFLIDTSAEFEIELNLEDLEK